MVVHNHRGGYREEGDEEENEQKDKEDQSISLTFCARRLRAWNKSPIMRGIHESMEKPFVTKFEDDCFDIAIYFVCIEVKHKSTRLYRYITIYYRLSMTFTYVLRNMIIGLFFCFVE